MLRSLRLPLLGALLCVGSTLFGCGPSTPDPVAFQNRTFYDYIFNGALDVAAFEKPWKPWDLPEQKPNPEYKGVAILNEKVHISRPVNWVIRDANNASGRRFIEYVSPNAYVFAIYERMDRPNELWRDIMNRYEQDVKDAGAQIVGSRIPMATYNAQGREFIIKRGVAAAKSPFVSVSREFLLRSDNRIILVQVVHQGETLKPISDELWRVIQSIEVL